MSAPIETAGPMTRDRVALEDTWDLSRIFASEADWETAAAGIEPLLNDVTSRRGHFADDATTLAASLTAMFRLRLALEQVQTYATLRHHEDIGDTNGLARYERAVSLAMLVSRSLAFVEPELLAVEPARFATLVADPAVAPWRHWLDDLGRRRDHTRSVEVEELLAQAADVGRGPSEVFSALDNVDVEYGEIPGENGLPVVLTKGRHGLMLRSRDRALRQRASEAFMPPYLAHDHTLAALYSASVRNDIFYARARNFASARDAALFDDFLPAAVYDNLIAEVRAAQPVLSDFLHLRKRLLGLDSLRMYDMYVPLSPDPEADYTYREGADLVVESLAALGSRYQTDLRRGFEERWVDVHETKGKRSGAYSWGAYGSPPVILMNWNGTFNDVFTLAHEAGHAMHSFYSDAALPFHDAAYPIFLAEIASTVNETLMNWHLQSRLDPDDARGRFALLNRFTDGYYATVVRQTMFAEFEHLAHAKIEARQPVTLADYNQLFGELAAAYMPGVENDEALRITWGRIPHFYRAFYVFQYATGLSTALTLAAAIRDEGEPARDRYLKLISSGGSDYPLNLLNAAGVDLASGEPVRTGLKEFARAVAEMTAIANSGALDK